MTTVNDICQFVDELAPRELAEDWDNVGLLVGDRQCSVKRVMTCLTITPESAGEAIDQNVDLIVTHHPLPFRPVPRLTTDQTGGRLLLSLIKSSIAVVSPHTAFDSAAQGINQMLTKRFGMENVRPLIQGPLENTAVGTARIASTKSPMSLAQLIETAKQVFELPRIQFVGDPAQAVKQVAFACGSGGSLMDQAIQAGCDAFVTGETNFHTCLEAKATGTGLILLGHFTSERFAVEALSVIIQNAFPQITVWSSQHEVDPLSVA